MASNTSKRVDWSPGKRGKAVALREEGYTYEEIAKRLGSGATKSGVRKLCIRVANTGSTKSAARTGRKSKLTQQDVRRICRLALQDRRRSAKEINNIIRTSGVQVCDRTIRKKLYENGLRARTPRKKPYLNQKQRQKRIEWARVHKEWTEEDWDRIIWSDETKISIFGSDGVKFVRRRPGEDLLPECTTATMKHPVSVMVWGSMATHGVGRLAIIEGNINAKMYQKAVLEAKLWPTIRDLFEGDPQKCIFQQDNAPCHTAKSCMRWFSDHHITVLPWPGNSPDLNPIENLWSRLKVMVSRQNPSNRRELIEAIIQAWYHLITSEDLRRLVHSMPRRIEAVLKNKGYPTKY
ncbi:Transposable element Tc1 transposase [Anthophora plagiata]